MSDKKAPSPSSNENDPLVNSLSKLQSNEKLLYKELDRNANSGSPSLEVQSSIIRQINENATIRSTLYSQLIDSAAAESSQGKKISSVQNELDITKAYLDNMRSSRDGLIRLAEINTYYTKQYDAQANIMKSIVYITLPILMVAVLRHYSLVSQSIAKIVYVVVAIAGLVLLMNKLVDMAWRSNRYYDQYDFPFDDSDVSLSQPSNNTQPNLEVMEMQCIGQECCPEGNTHNAIWNNDLGQCIYEESPQSN